MKLDKIVATKMPSLAARGLCLKKHDDAIEMLFEGITRWIVRFEQEVGSKALDIIRENQCQLGFEVAKALKEEYDLGDDVDAALDLMWMLIIPFGIRMKAHKIGEGRIREEKIACPIYDVFRRNDVDYCELLRISLGNGWLHAINPNLTFELVRRGSKNHYCIKDIVDTSKSQ